MLEPSELAEAFARNVGVIQAQTEGLSHADSLLQLPFRGNCLNWVLGHLLDNRDDVLKALGAQRIMNDNSAALYRRGSAPIASSTTELLLLQDLLEQLVQSQERLSGVLARTTEADMTREIVRNGNTTTLGKLVFFLYFHETYHVGQTELLRQLAGKNDQVI
jgi:uncharacterized damage-inducible protein DinB